MIRRIVLAVGVLVALASISSCTTFSRSDAAAEVNGEELTRAELNLLTNGATDATTVRQSIDDWLRLAVIGGDISGITSADDLQARRQDAITALSAPFLADARTKYELGLDGSPVLCLGAIPLAPGTDPNQVLAELQGGMSWADAATKYSSDPSFAQSGGLVLDSNGTNCLDPAGFTPGLLQALRDINIQIGVPAAIDLSNTTALVVLRPFDSLTATEQSSLVVDQLNAEISTRLSNTKIYVNPRFGRWDEATVSVVSLGAG